MASRSEFVKMEAMQREGSIPEGQTIDGQSQGTGCIRPTGQRDVWESYVAELGKDKVTSLSTKARPSQPICVKPKTSEPEEFTDNRIYVSNIPFSFREIDLANMFAPYGRVQNVEIVTNERGSKGFGFVTLDSREGCEKARKELHETHVQGRIIEVRKATPSRRKGIPAQHWLSAVPNEGKFIPQAFLDKSKPDATWIQRIIAREVERQTQDQRRRAYEHILQQIMGGLVHGGQPQPQHMQGQQQQQPSYDHLLPPHFGHHNHYSSVPASPMRRSPPRTAPTSPFIRTDFTSPSRFSDIAPPSSVGHFPRSFDFPPPLPPQPHSHSSWNAPGYQTSVDSANTDLHRNNSARFGSVPMELDTYQVPANLYGSMGLMMERMQPQLPSLLSSLSTSGSSSSSLPVHTQPFSAHAAPPPIFSLPSFPTSTLSSSSTVSTAFDPLDSTLSASSDVFVTTSQFGPIGARPPSAKSSASTDEGIHMSSDDRGHVSPAGDYAVNREQQQQMFVGSNEGEETFVAAVNLQ